MNARRTACTCPEIVCANGVPKRGAGSHNLAQAGLDLRVKTRPGPSAPQNNRAGKMTFLGVILPGCFLVDTGARLLTTKPMV